MLTINKQADYKTKHRDHSIWSIKIIELPCQTASSFYLKNQTENKYMLNVLEIMVISLNTVT